MKISFFSMKFLKTNFFQRVIVSSEEYLCHPPASSFISSCSVLFSPLPVSMTNVPFHTFSPFLSFPLLSSVPFSFLCRSFANHNSYFSAQFLSAAISVLFPFSFLVLFPLSSLAASAFVQ